MLINDRDKWNNKFRSRKNINDKPAQVLTENLHLLPQTGTALDLACGLGANAMLMAKRGLTTHAWDNSDVALDMLNATTKHNGIRICIEQKDIVKNPPCADSFDVIIVSHFLERCIVNQIINALKKNGLLFYQTFTRNKIVDSGPGNTEYLLERNELLRLFANLSILYYLEYDQVGNLESGNRNEAMLVAQKT
ncbi:MAG: tellurite methyltransferase [Gammaproteobacteria bacterium]|jgi:tellurite methyltransferase